MPVYQYKGYRTDGGAAAGIVDAVGREQRPPARGVDRLRVVLGDAEDVVVFTEKGDGDLDGVGHDRTPQSRRTMAMAPSTSGRSRPH